MTNSEIIEKLTKTDRYKTICKRYCLKGQLGLYELYNEFLIVILETDNKKLLQLIETNRIDSHCRNTIYWLAKFSNTSWGYVNKIEKLSIVKKTHFWDALEHENEPTNKELFAKAIEITINNESYWFNQRLMELYVSGLNIYQIALKTTIHNRYLVPVIKKFKEQSNKNYRILCTQ